MRDTQQPAATDHVGVFKLIWGATFVMAMPVPRVCWLRGLSAYVGLWPLADDESEARDVGS